MLLLCTTKYYSSSILYYNVLLCTTLCYKGLLQYYTVIQSTTPVLLCTTKYYPSSTLYYKVRLQATLYCKELQRTTPVLQSTTPVLFQYYKRTTPVLLCTTTKYYSSTTLYYNKVLLQYYPVLQSSNSWFILDTYETSFTMLGATKSPPTSANTAPATQNESHDWSASHMKSHLQCAEQQGSPSNFTKYCACHAKRRTWLTPVTCETSLQCTEPQASPSTGVVRFSTL